MLLAPLFIAESAEKIPISVLLCEREEDLISLHEHLPQPVEGLIPASFDTYPGLQLQTFQRWHLDDVPSSLTTTLAGDAIASSNAAVLILRHEHLPQPVLGFIPAFREINPGLQLHTRTRGHCIKEQGQERCLSSIARVY